MNNFSKIAFCIIASIAHGAYAANPAETASAALKARIGELSAGPAVAATPAEHGMVTLGKKMSAFIEEFITKKAWLANTNPIPKELLERLNTQALQTECHFPSALDALYANPNTRQIHNELDKLGHYLLQHDRNHTLQAFDICIKSLDDLLGPHKEMLTAIPEFARLYESGMQTLVSIHTVHDMMGPSLQENIVRTQQQMALQKQQASDDSKKG
jgi:hypothetical protein